MTLDGLLGALALCAALFALVPAVQRLRASLALPLQTILALTALLGILWLELYEPALPCPVRLGCVCDWLTFPGDPETVARKDAFLIVLVWTSLAYALHHFSRVRIGSVPALARLAARLVDENRLGEALSLLAPHIDLFVAASQRLGRWQKLHDRLSTFALPDPFSLGDANEVRLGHDWPGWMTAIIRFSARTVPGHRAAEAAALDIFQLVHRSPQVIAYLADQRPDLAGPYLRAKTYSRGDFSDGFLEYLIARPGSILYQEVEQNQNLLHPIGYALPERNRLLHTLFADCNFAAEIGAWTPIGNYLERLLDGAEKPGHINWLNGSAKWYEREWWRDPAYVSLFYFDIMVSSAIAQGVRNHMWLFYFPYFADRLARAYDAEGEDIDCNAEFPTRSARLLYEIISYLAKWIEVLPELPDGSPHKTLPDNRDRTGTNIPFSAATALGRSFAAILRADRINVDLLETLHTVIARTIRDLPSDGPNSRLRQWVIAELLAGGGGTLPNNYYGQLAVLLMNADHVLRFELEDYSAAIDEAERR